MGVACLGIFVVVVPITVVSILAGRRTVKPGNRVGHRPNLKDPSTVINRTRKNGVKPLLEPKTVHDDQIGGNEVADLRCRWAEVVGIDSDWHQRGDRAFISNHGRRDVGPDGGCSDHRYAIDSHIARFSTRNSDNTKHTDDSRKTHWPPPPQLSMIRLVASQVLLL
jgi:hypothetical protein